MPIYVDKKKCSNEAMIVSRKNLSYVENKKSLGDIYIILKIIFDKKCFHQLGINVKNNFTHIEK